MVPYQITDHAHAQGKDRGGGGFFKGGGDDGHQREYEGDDTPDRHPLQDHTLHKQAHQGRQGIQRPFEDDFVSCQHGEASFGQRDEEKADRTANFQVY